ncbi:hypothetical protein KY290_016478 [Solanum tuberosum]|uniref:DOG1 domain-containing protein n=1 Tax=Solanum tuberosum TaxID=4113 RepID=A0ABQ7VBJ0_SOLTU|nr:hypothetical protein KY290_016478 [Solanum tuberosum]
MANSSSDRKKEEDLYNSWMNNQQEELKELQNGIVARKNELNNDELNELLRKMVNNFQEYVNAVVDSRESTYRRSSPPLGAPLWKIRSCG